MTTETNFGVPKNQRIIVSEIFLESFEGKLKRFFPNKNKAASFFSMSLRDDRTIVAFKNGVAVGFAGLDYSGKKFIDVNIRQTVALFGLGIVRVALFGAIFILDRAKPNELHLASLAVSESERGCGVGTKLLQSTIDHARSKGFSRVRLEVIETNLDAKRLYKRFGFRQSKVQKIPQPLSKILGFGSVTEMVYQL